MAGKMEDRIIYGYTVDVASVNAVVAQSDRAIKSQDKFTEALDRTSTIGGRSIGKLASDGRKIRSLDNDFASLRQEVIAYGDAAEAAYAKGSRLSTVKSPGRFGNALEGIDQIGSSSSQILSGLGLGEGANTAGLVGDLAGAFGKLNPMMLLTTGAGIGLTAVLGEVSKGIEAQKKALEGQFAVQQTYYDALQNLTTEQVREEIEKRQRANEILQQQINETQGSLDSAFQQASGAFGDLGARLLDNQLPTAQLRTQLEELKGQLAINQGEVARFTQGLEINAFAANSAAAAAQANADAFATQIRDEFSFRARAADLRANGTSEQLKAIYEQNQIEQILNDERISQLRPYADASENVRAEVAQLIKRQEELAQQNYILRTSVEGVIEARERESAAASRITEQYEQLQKAWQEEGRIRDEMAKLDRESTEAQAKSEAEIAKIRTSAGDDLAKAETERRDSRTEAEAKDRKAREKDLEEHLKKLAQINKTYENDSLSAIANRDAAALDQASIRAKQESDAEKEEYKDRQKELDDALKEQYESIDKRYQQEQIRIEAAARQAINTENQRFNAEQQIRNTAYAQLRNDLINNIVAQQNIAQNGSGGLLQIHTDMWNSLNNLAAQGRALVESQWAGLGGGSQPQTPISSYGVPPINPQVNDTWTDAFGTPRMWNGYGWVAIPQYATGLEFARNRHVAVIDPGEGVLTAPENQVWHAYKDTLGGGLPPPLPSPMGYAAGSRYETNNDVTVPVYLTSGMSRQAMKEMVWEVMDEAIDGVSQGRRQ